VQPEPPEGEPEDGRQGRGHVPPPLVFPPEGEPQLAAGSPNTASRAGTSASVSHRSRTRPASSVGSRSPRSKPAAPIRKPSAA
jgi:hypothetical protein